jgi:two-component system response regulator MtrA
MTARVLVVDDESVTRRVVTFALKTVDIETVGVADGGEAVELAAREHFDLAIVDINLLGMDGFSVVEQMKALPGMQQMPVIMFTARHNRDDITQAMSAGAVDFLYKPFSTQELRDLVVKHLRGHLKS